MTPHQFSRSVDRLTRLRSQKPQAWAVRKPLPDPLPIPIAVTTSMAIKEAKRICDCFGITIEDVCEANRSRTIMPVRYIISHDLKEKFNLSLSMIGHILNRNHASILNHIKQYNNLTSTKDRKFLAMVGKVKTL